MGGIVLAWLFGEGLMFWRWSKAGAPPTPGAVALSSGYFALLGAIATYPPARTAATLAAVGINVAALLQILPGSTVHQQTGWPPGIYTGTAVFPDGKTEGQASNPSGGSGPGGGPVPSGPNTLPPGQAPPPNQGVIFPPGSGNL